jgi:4-diphosphocytidyl-2-C-methyl-D-erythritol kinase
VTEVLAPAKLTLTLRITGTRADGYHLLDADMVSLELADVLSIDPAGSGITVSGPYAAGVPTDASNLVARALALAGRTAAVHVDKRIPHGGGLGGGSADAAAVLRWAGVTDLVAASRLGADIPFCIVGGRARVRGIGEVVEPVQHEPMDVTLVVPPLHVSTPAVYRAWDDLVGPTGAGPNDLEPAALVVEPALARWRDRIAERAGVAPVLAGSGATWFVPGDRSAALAGLDADGAAVLATRTVPRPEPERAEGWAGATTPPLP